MPGYPFLIHLFTDIRPILLLQVLLSSLKVPLMDSIGARIGLEGRWQFIPLILIAVEPMDVMLAGSLLTESLFSFLLILAVHILMCRSGVGSMIGCGIVMAAACYLRPNGMTIALVLLAFILFRGMQYRLQAALFFSATIILLIPWMYRNLQVSDRPYLSDSGVVVAGHFHVPEVLQVAGDATASSYREHLHQLAASTDWTDRRSMRSYFDRIQDEVSSTFMEHPITWLQVMIEKAGKILLAPGRGHVQQHFPDPLSGRTILVVSIMISVIMVIGLGSFIFNMRRARWVHWLLIAMTGIVIISGSISAADARFKDPAMPFLLLIACWSFAQIGRRFFTPGSARALSSS